MKPINACLSVKMAIVVMYMIGNATCNQIRLGYNA